MVGRCHPMTFQPENHDALRHQFNRWLVEHYSRFLWLARHKGELSEEDGKDILQEACLKMWDWVLANGQMPASPKTFIRWLRVDWFRKRAVRKDINVQMDLALEEIIASVTSGSRSENLALLEEAIDRVLTPFQCEIVELRYFKEYSREETAKELSISVNQVDYQTVLALKAIKNYIERHG